MTNENQFSCCYWIFGSGKDWVASNLSTPAWSQTRRESVIWNRLFVYKTWSDQPVAGNVFWKIKIKQSILSLLSYNRVECKPYEIRFAYSRMCWKVLRLKKILCLVRFWEVGQTENFSSSTFSYWLVQMLFVICWINEQLQLNNVM